MASEKSNGGGPSSAIKDGDFVKSLARGLMVIQSFDAEHPSQTLSDVARQTGLSRVTARRLLLTLLDLGYVNVDGRSFELAPGTLRLGYSYLSALGMPEVAQPYLQSLSKSIDESCSMTVLDGAEIVYVARAAANRLFSLTLGIGSRLPAFCTSMGRVLLSDRDDADLERILSDSDLVARTEHTITAKRRIRAEIDAARKQGWYVIDQELELGVRAAAAPVRDRSGRIVAAVNVSAAVARMSLDQLVDDVVPEVVQTAAEISSALRNR